MRSAEPILKSLTSLGPPGARNSEGSSWARWLILVEVLDRQSKHSSELGWGISS